MTKKKREHLTQVWLYPEEKQMLEELSEKSGLSMSDVIRQAIRAYAKAHEGKAS